MESQAHNNNNNNNKGVPPAGIVYLTKIRRKEFTIGFHKGLILLITFVAYALFHASRKAPSIVKSAWDPQESNAVAANGTAHFSLVPSRKDVRAGHDGLPTPPPSTPSGWAPFTGSTGKDKLGQFDFAFLAFYAVGIFFAGHLGDRVDLRWFLSVGMVGSGVFACLIGMAYWWDIHILTFYIMVQMAAGLFQATGWPSVVAVVGNWFGKSKRGLIMGIWNAHTSTGNILGSLIAAAVLQYGWGWSFVLPGLLLVLGGVMVFFFLVVEPADVGFESPYETNTHDAEGENMQLVRLKTEGIQTLGSRNDPAIGFLEAWQIPGVATYALCLFFSKLVAYTFLYWLPFYISQTRIAGSHLNDKIAGDLSTLFDVGGVIGGIVAGYASDCLSARAITSASFMLCAIPVLHLYRAYSGISLPVNIGLMMLLGMFINGPYSLITTAVSADLGTHSSLKGSGRALATVTAIIDGTGSMGAAIGPLLAGFISENFGWGAVFTMLMLAALLSGLLLTKLVIGEVREKLEMRLSRRTAHNGLSLRGGELCCDNSTTIDNTCIFRSTMEIQCNHQFFIRFFHENQRSFEVF
ncbi:unnamed protein product [Sphagnum jensenii]|uniref:Major facilitator superfamily (MFS) profile domain-containing protein n=1 Tax=Sphagnum jensenii TaxID=128206 RepID=A0ABP1A4L4_9BRYO